MLAPADGPEYGTIESLADGLVDGIIAVSPLVDSDWLEEPGVSGAGGHAGAPRPTRRATTPWWVTTSRVRRAAMRHLLELGHRRIAHLTEAEAVTAPGSGTPHALRLQTYLA